MASVTLSVNQVFPAGQLVGAYPDTSVSATHTGSPHATALVSAPVATTGELTMTSDELVAGGRYVAAADIGTDDWRYLYFNVDVIPDDPMTEADLVEYLDEHDITGGASGASEEYVDEGDAASVSSANDYADQILIAAQDYADGPTTVTTQTAATYTFALTDAQTIVEGNRAGTQTFTVPPNSTTAFPTGTVIQVTQIGAGAVTIAAGSGVTLRAPSGLTVGAQYGSAFLVKRGTDEWIVATDIDLVTQAELDAQVALLATAEDLTALPINVQTGSYTLVLGDAGSSIDVTSASGTALTIPPNASVAFTTGTVIEVAQLGAGTVTLTQGAGVTIEYLGGTGNIALAGENAVATLRKRATNIWLASGALA